MPMTREDNESHCGLVDYRRRFKKKKKMVSLVDGVQIQPQQFSFYG